MKNTSPGYSTALNTIKGKPSHKVRVFKQVSRRLAEAEEWINFYNRKTDFTTGSINFRK